MPANDAANVREVAGMARSYNDCSIGLGSRKIMTPS